MPLYLGKEIVSGISLGIPGKSAYDAAIEANPQLGLTEEEFYQKLGNFEESVDKNYVDQKVEGLTAESVKADPSGTAKNVVNEHNNNGKAHEDIRVLIENSKPSCVVATMLASSWSNNTYSFEATYPYDEYDISIEVAPTATSEQFEAFGGAMICGSHNSNVATAIGNVPTVNIPIIIKVVKK